MGVEHVSGHFMFLSLFLRQLPALNFVDRRSVTDWSRFPPNQRSNIRQLGLLRTAEVAFISSFSNRATQVTRESIRSS